MKLNNIEKDRIIFTWAHNETKDIFGIIKKNSVLFLDFKGNI